ncbi:MAG TPA: ferrous iron transport protein A [Candidatus Onthoplasma faecigallinarum]|nr:ferrous iron transport protein A [Candidatus Onthoplasma faecigallinarum]
MSLYDVKLNTDCIVKELKIADEKMKIRIMELGLNVGSVLRVKSKSVLKKTFLIVFHSSCFTLKDDVAKMILVNYV